MAYKEVSKNAMLDAEKANLTHVSAHTAFPATAANEVTGGTYARQTISWGTASGGSLSKTASNPVFDIPGGTTVSAIGFGGATGEPRVDADVTDEAFGSNGTYTLTAATLNLNA